MGKTRHSLSSGSYCAGRKAGPAVQVYDGSRSYWREEEAGSPANAYGRSKLEAEQVVQVQSPPLPGAHMHYPALHAHPPWLPCTCMLRCALQDAARARLDSARRLHTVDVHACSRGPCFESASHHAQARWPEHVILRSSIIYGPEGLAPVPRPLFIQFIARQLAAQAPTSFFTDEWRNSIYVHDIVAVVLKLLQGGAAQLPRRCRHPLAMPSMPQSHSAKPFSEPVSRAAFLSQAPIRLIRKGRCLLLPRAAG